MLYIIEYKSSQIPRTTIALLIIDRNLRSRSSKRSRGRNSSIPRTPSVPQILMSRGARSGRRSVS